MTRETLEHLVARYLGDGDEEAAEQVVSRTRPKLLAVARRIGSPQDAEDAVHTAYLSLLHKRGGALDAPVLPWLVTAVVRIAYRHKARAQRQAELCRRLAQVVPTASPAVAAAQREEIRRLRGSVDRLPGKYRDPVVLHYLQGLTTKEVAALLEISPSAVKKRLQRARTLLLGVLSPWFVYPLVAGPWLLADTVQASSNFVVGGVMKFKGAAIITTVVLAVGAAGVGVGASLRSGPGATTTPRGSRKPADAQVARLLAELESARARERALLQARAAALSGASVAPAEEGAESRRDGTRKFVVSERFRAAAEASGVGAAALEAATTAEGLVRGQYAQPQLNEEALRALRELRGFGEEGFLAIVVLLRSGLSGAWFDRLLRESWSPGWERHLIAAAQDPAVPLFPRWSLLSSLGVADTPEVRRFLLDFVERSEDAGLVMSAASALGTLREAAGARHIEDKLMRPGWDGVRPHLLAALGAMGGADAERILLAYLRHPKAGHLFYAVMALMKVNPDAGATEAERILDGPESGDLGDVARRYLEGFAGRK